MDYVANPPYLSKEAACAEPAEYEALLASDPTSTRRQGWTAGGYTYSEAQIERAYERSRNHEEKPGNGENPYETEQEIMAEYLSEPPSPREGEGPSYNRAEPPALSDRSSPAPILFDPKEPAPVKAASGGAQEDKSEEPKEEEKQQKPKVEDDGEKTCRICFDGEDEAELGRLFSPCICKGSAKYVHVVCLNRWREASAGHSSAYKCDQCRYEYKLRRTKISGLASNRLALTSITFLLLSFLVFLSGFLASFVIELVDTSQSVSTYSSYGGGGYGFGGLWGGGGGYGGGWDGMWVSDHLIIGETIRTAVDFFEGKVEAIAPSTMDGITYTEPVEDEYELLAQEGDRLSGRRPKSSIKKLKPRLSIWRRSLNHCIKGFSLVGFVPLAARSILTHSSLVSFLQFSFSTLFLGPFGFRSTIFRLLSPRRGRRDERNGGGGVGIAEVILVSFVLVGMIKAVRQLYTLVRWSARKALARVEVLVMEVK